MKRETKGDRRDQIPGGPTRRPLPSTVPILSGAIADPHLFRTVITAGSSSSVTLMVTTMLSMAPDGSVAVTTTV